MHHIHEPNLRLVTKRLRRQCGPLRTIAAPIDVNASLSNLNLCIVFSPLEHVVNF